MTGDEAGALQQEVLDLCRALLRVDTTNGNETAAALVLRDYLTAHGVECELVARDPARANLVARLPGTGRGPVLGLVGHLDVVPADPRDWTHPPFAAVVDDEGYLFGRGALDMKNEVAARAVTLAVLAREGFRPAGDLLLVVAADEEDGTSDVGMRWLVRERPDLRLDLALNEGAGVRLELADGRVVVPVAVGEKGTFPVRVTALGEAGHASMPTLGANAVPLLARLLDRVGAGLPDPDLQHPVVDRMLQVLAGQGADPRDAVATARRLHPTLGHVVPALLGTTMAPTVLAGSRARNVLPARASAELDCRILPGTTEADVERAVRARLGADVPYELSFPERLVPGSASPASGPLFEACQSFLDTTDPGAVLLPMLCTGFTDSAFLRSAFGTTAYGFNPVRRTPADVVESGYHSRDERIHVDDLGLSLQFHLHVVRRLLAG